MEVGTITQSMTSQLHKQDKIIINDIPEISLFNYHSIQNIMF